MAKPLVFQTDKAHPFSITKLDRKKLYGWKELVAYDSNGEKCIKADIDASGSFIIPKGGRTLGVLDNEGNWVEKKELKAVYKDGGTPAVPIASSFDHPIKLQKTVTVEEFLDHSIESVYLLEPEDGGKELVKQVKKSDKIFTFTFNYRTAYEGSPAFIIESKGKLFILVGYLCPFDFIGLDQVGDIGAEEDEEEFEEDIDFSMM